jgi:hypothetical protein
VEAWDESELTFSEHFAKPDQPTCSGVAVARTVARARAIVPGVIYGFRACQLCGGSFEELVLIGPPAIWTASSADVEEQLRPHGGSFTMLRVPVQRGSSASAVLHVDGGALAYFMGLRGDTAPWTRHASMLDDVFAYTVEVSWPAAADTPDAIAFVSEGPSEPPSPQLEGQLSD